MFGIFSKSLDGWKGGKEGREEERLAKMETTKLGIGLLTSAGSFARLGSEKQKPLSPLELQEGCGESLGPPGCASMQYSPASCHLLPAHSVLGIIYPTTQIWSQVFYLYRLLKCFEQHSDSWEAI